MVWGCSQAIHGFPVTLSNCKVKTTKFYKFLFTLAWRWTKNKSLYKFPFPWHISLQKYSNLNFWVFTVRDTKIGMLSRWKKVSSLDFQQYNHFKYLQKICLCARMLVLEWQERAFIEKVDSRCFCRFLAAILVDQNGTPIWCLHTKLYEGAWNVLANNSETVGHKDLKLGQIVYILLFYNISFSWLLALYCFQFIF